MTHAHLTLERAAAALIADVRRRYPGEALRCPYMIELDRALSELTAAPAETPAHRCIGCKREHPKSALRLDHCLGGDRCPNCGAECVEMVETPAQDAPDEVAEIEKRIKFWRSGKAHNPHAALNEMLGHADARLRLLKQRRLVTRERLAQVMYDGGIFGVCRWKELADDHQDRADFIKRADALLSADLGFKVVSEEEMILTARKAREQIHALNASFQEQGAGQEAQALFDAEAAKIIARYFMRLIADGSAK